MITESIENSAFLPRSFLKNRHLQSVMASTRLLIGPHRFLLERSQEIILETAAGSRLLAHVSPHPASRGLIIILHGWEGSSSSAYVLAAGAHFYSRGFSVARLNLRDHGESHHLNEGLFHGALLDETFDAVNALAASAAESSVYLMGFSLGANFALRIAIRHSEKPIRGLRQVFAISPPLDPYKTTLAIDGGPGFYRKYFLKKWRRSLKKKQRLYPQKYNFTKMLHADTCLALTEKVMTYFPEFPSYRDYFRLYTLTKKSFRDLGVPVRIFIAQDDPVIPAEDFLALAGNRFLTVSRQKFGGHCGFIDLFPYRRWYNDRITEALGK
ncbi:MAG: alpha/beta fold hydrolase [Syntrophaceae bacterium]|nr:alpha/beta fold hydrolase [Syntrophaceae bacterium]